MESTIASRVFVFIDLCIALCIVSLGCGTDELLDEGEPFEFSERVPGAGDGVFLDAGIIVDTASTDRQCETAVWRIDPENVDFSLLAPNLYILLDTSGSMGEWENCMDPEVTGCCDECQTQLCCFESCCDRREPPFPIDEAKTALDVIADSLATKVRFGIGAFPSPTTLGTPSCGMTELLPMGEHRAAAVKQSYVSRQPEGATPTGASLWMVNDRRGLSDPADPDDSRRPKAMILITDGEPTYCEDSYPAVEEAHALARQGVDIYVVGFRHAAEEETLNAIAEAGETDNPSDETRRFFVADDTTELLAALNDISGAILGCTYTVEPTPQDPGEVRVLVNGEDISPATYSYDESTGTLQLSREVCEELKVVPDAPDVEVILGCPVRDFGRRSR